MEFLINLRHKTRQAKGSARLGRTPRGFPLESTTCPDFIEECCTRTTHRIRQGVALVGGSQSALRHVRHFPFQLSQFSSVSHRPEWNHRDKKNQKKSNFNDVNKTAICALRVKNFQSSANLYTPCEKHRGLIITWGCYGRCGFRVFPVPQTPAQIPFHTRAIR